MLASAIAWIRATRSGRPGSPKRWPEPALEAQVRLDGLVAADRGGAGDLPRLRLEHGEEPGLLGEAGDPDRVARLRAPTERARHEDVEIARPADAHGPRRPCPRGRAGPRPSPWRRRGSRAPSRGAAGPCPARRECPGWGRSLRSWQSEPPAASRRSAGRPCSCRPRCRSRRTGRRRCARTSQKGSRSRCRPCPRRPPGRPRARRCVPSPASPPRRPSRPPGRCRRASASRRSATTSPDRASRRPPGSPSRSRRPAGRRRRA